MALTGGHGAWDIHRNEDDETDDDEVYRRPGEPIFRGSDEAGERVARASCRRCGTGRGGCDWFLLTRKMRVRKLFDLDTQRLKFNAQPTITVEWLVDEKGYASYENLEGPQTATHAAYL